MDCKRIVKKDNSGRIVAIGVEWTEFNMWADALRALACGVCLIVGVAMTLGGALATVSHGAWFFLVFPGLAIGGFSQAMPEFDIRRTPRSLIFHRDGRVEAAHGFGYWPKAREMSQPHSEIVSIEARAIDWYEAPFQYDVAVFRRDGDIVHVARLLRADEAHKVAVQLTHALAEIRASDSVGARRVSTGREPAYAIN